MVFIIGIYVDPGRWWGGWRELKLAGAGMKAGGLSKANSRLGRWQRPLPVRAKLRT